MNLTRRILEKPLYLYLNKRPYTLVHKLKESWVDEEIDSEGITVHAFYNSKTFCGLRLKHDKWDNVLESDWSYNCKICKKKELLYTK